MNARREGLEEALARQIVATVTGLHVDREDDGRAPSLPDALIRNGADSYPMEVVTDQDVAYLRQEHAFRKRGRILEVPGLGPGWYLAVRHETDVARLRANVVPLVLQLALERATGPVYHRISDELRALGVEYAEPTLGQRDVIYLTSEGWNSWSDSIDLPAWVNRVLSRNLDVATKLLAVPAHARHIFIWATFGSPMSMRRTLRADKPLDSHLATPELPEGIGDLWVACTMVGHRCVRWSKETGWLDTGWITRPEHEDADPM